MFYCENCYLLNEENTCAFCGSRLTRGPRPGDYCFVGNKCSPWAEMLHGILEDDHIPVIIRQWSPRTVAYTGGAPTLGYDMLAADASGGIKTTEAGGRTVLVTAVDSTAMTAEILL